MLWKELQHLTLGYERSSLEAEAVPFFKTLVATYKATGFHDPIYKKKIKYKLAGHQFQHTRITTGNILSLDILTVWIHISYECWFTKFLLRC
jgi:hypothetical protein